MPLEVVKRLESLSTKVCSLCGRTFPLWRVIGGKRKNLSKRRFCLDCVPLVDRGEIPDWDIAGWDDSKKADFWYMVGLIATDGYLNLDKTHIEIAQQDQALLESIRQRFGIRAEVKPGHRCFKLCIGSRILWRKLFAIGLTPCKSKTIGRLSVPLDYEIPFLRGVFDGDGSIYKREYSLKDGTKHQSWSWSLLSISMDFINYLKEILKRSFDLTPYRVDTDLRDGVRTVCFGAMRARPIVESLYKKGTLYLLRKKLLCEEMMAYIHSGVSVFYRIENTKWAQEVQSVQ